MENLAGLILMQISTQWKHDGQEGRKYTQRADETRLFIDELESKKDKTETDLQTLKIKG
ncbi:hypothetical protein BSPWISOXPB_4287 [uncultured Gammaproteobacteria bacterium]|nr:hypothetical protein BSPWISOXPB_4287 [uncultured Gammaproteobacteria bacterium]